MDSREGRSGVREWIPCCKFVLFGCVLCFCLHPHSVAILPCILSSSLQQFIGTWLLSPLGGPAEKAGLQQLDTVLQLNEQPVEHWKCVDLAHEIRWLFIQTRFWAGFRRVPCWSNRWRAGPSRVMPYSLTELGSLTWAEAERHTSICVKERRVGRGAWREQEWQEGKGFGRELAGESLRSCGEKESEQA